MAIDTEDKRRSVVGILPTADNVIDDNDRMQVAGLYSGIDPETPAVIEVICNGLLLRVY